MLCYAMVYVVKYLLELTVQCMQCFNGICRMCSSFEKNCEEVTPEKNNLSPKDIKHWFKMNQVDDKPLLALKNSS